MEISFRRKIVIGITILLLALGAITLISVYNNFKDRIVEQTNSQFEVYANQAAEGISLFFSNYETQLKFLTNLDEIRVLDKEGKEVINRFYGTHTKLIAGITRIDKDGNIVYTFPYSENIIGKNVSFQEHNKWIIEHHQPVLSDVFQAVQGYRTVAFAYPIFDNKGNYDGCLSLLIPFQIIITKYLNPIENRGIGNAWMISRQGTEIYCYDESHIGKSVEKSAEGFPKFQNVINEMKKGREGNAIYEFYKPHTSEKKLIYSFYKRVDLKNTYWSIAISTPEEKVFSSVIEFRNNLLVVTISLFFGILLILIIYYYSTRKAKEKLREQERLFQQVAEQTGQIVYDNHFNNNKLNIGGAVESITGYNRFEIETFSFKDWLGLVHKDDIDEYNKKNLNFLHENETKGRIEYRIKKKNGEYIFVEENTAIVYGKNGRALRILGSISDISERKENEAKLNHYKFELEKTVKERTNELQRANELLQAEIEKIKKAEIELKNSKEKAEYSEKLKMEFLAQMSHEIRTPINTIVSYNSLIKMEFENQLDEEMDECFRSIESAAHRLLRTIDLILNMSDIEAGTYEPKYENINFKAEIIDPLMKEFSRAADLKQIELQFVGEFNSDMAIADKYTSIQIIANLVDNAIKYTEKGFVRIKITEYEKQLAIQVEDTGVGISKEFIPDLFNVLSQEEQGYTRKFEGNGLGLALVKKYCNINSAEIDVKSQKGSGSVFTVTYSKI